MNVVSIFNPDPRSWDWGGIIENIAGAIGGIGTGLFGDKLGDLAEKMSKSSLTDFTQQSWQTEYAVVYGMAVFLGMIHLVDAGRRRSFTRQNQAEANADAIHPLKVIGVGLFIPFALSFLVMITDVMRQMAMYIPTKEANWWESFTKVVLPILGGAGNWLINQSLTALTTWALEREQELTLRMLYVFALPIIIGYVFIRHDKGRWFFQICVSVVLGLSFAYPLQIAVLRVSSSYAEGSFGVTLLSGMVAALLPLLATAGFARKVDFVKLAGGKAVLSGKVENTPTDDRPQSVRTAEDLAVEMKSTVPVTPLKSADKDSEIIPTMRPIVGERASSQGLVAQTKERLLPAVVNAAAASPDPRVKAAAAAFTVAQQAAEVVRQTRTTDDRPPTKHRAAPPVPADTPAPIVREGGEQQ